MRIILHSGTAQGVMTAVRDAVWNGRVALLGSGLVIPEALVGPDDDLTRAALPLGDLHPLASFAGLADPVDHQRLLVRVRSDLSRAITRHRPQVLFLSLPEAAIWLDSEPLLKGLARLLSDFSDDVRPVIHLAHPAEALMDLTLAQVAAGRSTGLEAEAQVARSDQGWWQAATELRQDLAGRWSRGAIGLQLPMPAIDVEGTSVLWASVFGVDSLTLRELPFGPATPETLAEVAADLCLPLELQVGAPAARRPSEQGLCRMLAANAALADLEKTLGTLPGALRFGVLDQCLDASDPITPEEFAPLTARLRPLIGGPVPVIRPADGFDPRPLLDPLPELLAAWHRDRLARRMTTTAGAQAGPAVMDQLSPAAQILLSPQALEVLKPLPRTPFWPQNRAGAVDEAAEMPPFPTEPGKKTDTLIVACMKNEGPYILEWIAYHLAIGIGHFLIFTNDCSDGTNEILDRLAELGYVTRCDNDVWKGQSPQQHALNTAMKMDLVKNSGWIIHIDIDEYINIRSGNGTMAELFDAMGPDATNLAMTWRLFGNGGVNDIGDGSVISNFTGCSPTYCPKPHTIWGFKSMTKNTGAYAKLSCHRPNKWDQTTPVKWLNGSLQDTTAEFRDKGWRSTVKTMGFDAVQLNHYALRSRESFLIKRQRGRALHVDRSIGLNYWVRHDWNHNQDRSILRQVRRMQAAKDALLADPSLAKLQAETLAWHKARVQDLLETETFRELWDQSGQAELTDPERVAYAIAAGMES